MTDSPSAFTFLSMSPSGIMKPLNQASVVTNLSKPGALEVGEALQSLCRDLGVEVRSTSDFPCPEGILDGSQACFSVGGDGTLLNLLEEAVRLGVPVAGVGLGKLGFLATFSPDQLKDVIPPIVRGEYKVRQRSLLGYCAKGMNHENLALNDLVIKSGANGRLGRFSVHAGDELVADYACDGIVFSTPTGSTAYNLASGGPIAHPEAKVMLMTPISAHSLTSRPVVFPAGMRLSVESDGNGPAPLLFADGRTACSSDPGCPIEVSVSERSFPLLEPLDHSHFRVLRNKLKWG